jgi:hypothetical protein
VIVAQQSTVGVKGGQGEVFTAGIGKMGEGNSVQIQQTAKEGF